MTIEEVKNNGWLIFETIAGSRAYGLDTAASDTDIRGVFVLPQEKLYGLEYIPQVSNESNDIVYYELKRFIELLSKNNPNIMELLAVPNNCILYRHDIMDMIKPSFFISKLCEKTFANYAYTQIKKASGLEKKIVNPMAEERKSVLDFCYIYHDQFTQPLLPFLAKNEWRQEDIGLTVVPHLRDCYHLFHSYERNRYAGIIKKENANEVSLSSIPKGEQHTALLYFNKDGYSVYCKHYKEYWDWVAMRNEHRYNTTMNHGKKYDSKNMMHVFRLLHMAQEIAIEGKINARRNDRDFLLAIKDGKFEYDELVEKANVLKDSLTDHYLRSGLQDEPHFQQADHLLVNMRKTYYSKTGSV